MDFALKPTEGEAHGCFCKVRPLVDTFNENRKDGVVDDSMSPWKGLGQRHGAIGCSNGSFLPVCVFQKWTSPTPLRQPLQALSALLTHRLIN
jgi:hypothetical protein